MSDVGDQPGEATGARETGLVHVERAVDLDLQGMDADLRPPVGLRDVSPGIGLVARHRVAEALQRLLGDVGDDRLAARAVAVAKDEVGPRPPSRVTWLDGMEWQSTSTAAPKVA
jgi:hypothetical protein